MSVVTTPPHTADMRSMLHELQSEAIVLALPAILGCGLLLLAAASRSFDPPAMLGLPGLALVTIAVVVWAWRGTNYLGSAWLLVAGCLLSDLWVAASAQLAPVLSLLALPVGLATLFVSAPAGAALAVGCTILLSVAPPWLLPADSISRWTAGLGLWGTCGLVALTLRPLVAAWEGSWSSYQASRKLLEEARDYQVRLKQTLADLAEANLQLTRLNRLTQSLRQAAEEARRAKEQFVANVSHELRTPLNMIVGFSEMIVAAPETYGEPLPPALLADLSVILRNSQHLSSLIDDVLDLSQIEAGQMALTRERASLVEIIEAAAVAVRPLYASKGLSLQVETIPDLEVYCDRTRIREVILNLLSNAGRFTERGGVRVRAARQGGDVLIAVADTGPGIAVADQDKLFRPFQQVDGSVRRRYGGTGLGLAISKSFVELHGGRMWCESEINVGTTFYVSLPIDPPAPIASGAARWISANWEYEEHPRRPEVPHPVVRPRFVVLESGSLLSRLLRRYLDGAEIASVASLEQAVEELGRLPATALLVNGDSVSDSLHQVLQETNLPYGTPAILCSLPGELEAAGALGVADYLIKPISREMLLGALERMPLQGDTVLVVDDEPEALRLFRRMLSSGGKSYRVLRAQNGRQALEVLARERPDAILLDLVMPDMDGFQLLAAKNADPALRDIPAIVLSARDPNGQPVLSNALAVTRGGGLSMPQLLEMIAALTRILSPDKPETRRNQGN